MEILFEQLKHLNFDIEKIFAMNQRWKNDSIFTMSSPRPTNALVFFRGGNAEITSEEFDAPLKIEKGSLCFIPSGKTYTWKFYNTGDENNIVCMLFEFIPKAEDGSQITLADNIKVVDDTHSTLYTQKFFELVNEFSKPQMSYPQLKAVGFSIIACASQALCEKVIFRQNLSSIYSGIQYLENNPAQDKSIDEIAKMCGVSLTYFERLFKEYSGMSPTRYRTLRKIDMAKAMLKNPLLSIEQIADELNYYDCAYFCKCFKKATGMTAHEYRLNAQGT